MAGFSWRCQRANWRSQGLGVSCAGVSLGVVAGVVVVDLASCGREVPARAAWRSWSSLQLSSSPRSQSGRGKSSSWRQAQEGVAVLAAHGVEEAGAGAVRDTELAGLGVKGLLVREIGEGPEFVPALAPQIHQ